MISEYRRPGKRDKSAVRSKAVLIKMDPSTHASLHELAERRGRFPTTLARELIEAELQRESLLPKTA